MSRQDQYALTVEINGTNTGIWDKMSGGRSSSDDNKYKPGNMGRHISLGGNTTIENITVSRLYDLSRDHNGVGGISIKTLYALNGRAQCKVTKQPLDTNGNAFGDPIVYTGVLMEVAAPDVDSESSDAALVEIVISTSGTVA